MASKTEVISSWSKKNYFNCKPAIDILSEGKEGMHAISLSCGTLKGSWRIKAEVSRLCSVETLKTCEQICSEDENKTVELMDFKVSVEYQEMFQYFLSI